MSASETPTPQSLRTNRERTIQLIRDRGPLSRSELSELTGLHSSTLTYITRSLLQAELIRTCGKKASSGVGKKQVLIEINPRYGWVAGVALEPRRVTLAILDASGAVVSESAIRSPRSQPLDQITEQLRTLAAECNLPLKRLRGVGVAAAAAPPGAVHVGGVGEREASLCESLADQFRVPVIFETRSNAAALAEARRGNASLVDTFIFLLLSREIASSGRSSVELSATLFLSGRLYRGARWNAGRISGSLATPGGLTLSDSDLAGLALPGGSLSRDARGFNERLLHVLEVLAALVDPQVIVIGADFPVGNVSWAAGIERALSQAVAPQERSPLPIRLTAFPELGAACGAALAAIDVALFRGQATGAIPFTP